LIAIGLAAAPVGWAQSDHSTVIRVLRGSRDFRARARAALALGGSADPRVTPHLVTSLSDDSPAVRAASATALGRLGDPAALGPLRGALSDQEPVVRNEAQRAIRRIQSQIPSRGAAGPTAPPRRRGTRVDPYPSIAVMPPASAISWPNIRYVVVIGTMENRSNFRDDTLSSLLQNEVSRNLLVLRGVAVLRAGHEPPDAAREIARRRLPKLRLEGSLNRVERRAQRSQVSVRCEVSLMLMDEPGRNLRSVLNGAATGSQPQRGQRSDQERRLAQQALTGAVRSAMSGAAQAISSAGN
jgi:hypothetical protein